MRQINSKVIFWAGFVVSTALFFYPFRAVDGTGLGLDKVVHFAIFAFLGFYGIRSYRGKSNHIFLLLAIYAFVVEYIQGNYVPNRALDWYDALAGGAGLLAVFFHQQTKK